ncbi:MAG: ATP synthase F1 subunit delta [Chitinophagales bacterium]|nr:ATP synthase F1 subunit delta [Chitinophagales bacterium]
MSLDKLSFRYATALYQEAAAQNTLDSSLQDVKDLIKIINSNDELNQLFQNPIVDVETKRSIVQSLFQSKLTPLVYNFLILLIDNKREAGVIPMLNKFIDIYNDKHGISNVQLILASEIDNTTLNKIESFIKTQSGKPNVVINKKVDESILGGFIINFGDRIYDNSVKRKLQQIKNDLILN